VRAKDAQAVPAKGADAIVPACAGGVCNPRRSRGSEPRRPRGNTCSSTSRAPVFLAGEVVKQGGGPGLSFVSLDIDAGTS